MTARVVTSYSSKVYLESKIANIIRPHLSSFDDLKSFYERWAPRNAQMFTNSGPCTAINKSKEYRDDAAPK